jgi:hypothetical protein
MLLNTQPADFEQLFESAPISLWLEDYSALKALFVLWRSEGVTDLVSHIQSNPSLAAQCSACYQLLQVNQKTLDVFSASSQAELLSRLPEIFKGDMLSFSVRLKICSLPIVDLESAKNSFASSLLSNKRSSLRVFQLMRTRNRICLFLSVLFFQVIAMNASWESCCDVVYRIW